MSDIFVTEKICELKHKEVEDMKEEITKLRDCIHAKFGKLYILLFGVLTALLVNLATQLMR